MAFLMGLAPSLSCPNLGRRLTASLARTLQYSYSAMDDGN
jgi:hypothetical protein